jgi:hypothetical protein
VACNFKTGNNKLLTEYEMNFPGRWVGLDEPIPWPPRSRNITPLDFVLWGYDKDIVYKTPMTSLHELKHRIVVAVETATPQMLENTWKEIEYCLEILRAIKGARVGVI